MLVQLHAVGTRCDKQTKSEPRLVGVLILPLIVDEHTGLNHYRRGPARLRTNCGSWSQKKSRPPCERPAFL